MVVFLYAIEVVILVVLVCIAIFIIWLIAGTLVALAFGLAGHAIGRSKERPGRARVRPRIPEALRRAVLERDNWTCVYCGASGKGADLEIDHIVPVSRGGATTYGNLQVTCKQCNDRKGAS